MIPPPITSSRSGTDSGDSASVESITRGSSGLARELRRLRAGGDDAVLKRDLALADAQRRRAGEARRSVHDLDLALLGEPVEPFREPVDDGCLPADQRRDVDRRVAESDAVRGHLLGLGDHSRGVQQRLGGDAADVQAHAAEAFVALDERDPQSEVRGAERRRVAADPGAEDDHLEVAIAVGGGGRCGRRGLALDGGVRARVGGFGLARPGTVGLERHQHAPLRYAVPDRDAQLRDRAGARCRHVHRRLIGLERDERVLDRDLVARRDVDLDHRDIGEVADVGDAYFRRRHNSARRRSDRTVTRKATNRAAAAPSITRWS